MSCASPKRWGFMSELERVYDAAEIVEEKPDWLQPAVSQWNDGLAKGLQAALQQMEAAFYAMQRGGKEGMDMLSADAVRAKRSKVYAFAKTYRVLVETYQQGVSARLDNSPLDPWQLVESVVNGEREGDVEAAIARTELENTSTRALRDERKDRRNVQTVEKGECPHCEREFLLREMKQWTEEVG